jgi:hypothetical protein
MKSADEWQKEHDRMLPLLEQARQELARYPGVVSVELGIKERAGELTDDLSFRVYVRQKRSPDTLGPGQTIPDRVLGIKTDVIQSATPARLEDIAKYRPLLGGIRISNGARVGTLGCIARLISDGSIVALSNSHVVRGDVSRGADVGQPRIAGACCCRCDVIGTLVDDLDDATVDCGIVRLNPLIEAENVVHLLNDDGTDVTLLGDAPAKIDMSIVRKSGIRTGRTTGTIVSLTHPPPHGPTEIPKLNQILIKPTAGTPLFADHGDSGSVVVDASGHVVGLLWAGYPHPADGSLLGHGIACPIGPVLSSMGIVIITGALLAGSYANPFTRATPAAGAEESRDNDQLATYLQHRLEQSARGRQLWDVVERHKDEVLHLVNHDRVTKVMWQRKQGPAFVAALARSARISSYRIPEQIHGVSKIETAASLYQTLNERGSSALRGDLAVHGPAALEAFARSLSLEDLLVSWEYSRCQPRHDTATESMPF